MHCFLKLYIALTLFTVVTIIVIVPVTLHFRSKKNAVSLSNETTTATPYGLCTISLTNDDFSDIRLNCSSALTTSSQTFCREEPCPPKIYYYEAMEFNVSTSGIYSIWSNSNMATHGLLYKNGFDPASPSSNQISSDSGSGGNDQFKLIDTLQTMTNYTLVTTTFYPNITGMFTIIVVGPGSISLIGR